MKRRYCDIRHIQPQARRTNVNPCSPAASPTPPSALSTGWRRALLPSEKGPAHQQTGRRGERDAYFYLRKLGYVMVARNFRSPRRRGEIDLIGSERGSMLHRSKNAHLARSKARRSSRRPREAARTHRHGSRIPPSLAALVPVAFRCRERLLRRPVRPTVLRAISECSPGGVKLCLVSSERAKGT